MGCRPMTKFAKTYTFLHHKSLDNIKKEEGGGGKKKCPALLAVFAVFTGY